MGKKLDDIKIKWKALKGTSTFHDSILLLIFIAISTLFWVIMALNDSAQDSFDVKVSIVNCPDSVTFISDIPEKIHVTVRDKGSVLWRNHYRHPNVNINFREYASNGVLNFPNNDLQTSLKSIFGSTSQILSLSLDSIYLDYTTGKGKRVPVLIDANASTTSGNVIEGLPRSKPTNVLIYGERTVIDTIRNVITDPVRLSDLSETTSIDAKLKRIDGVRIIPSSVVITFPVERLVKKHAAVTVDVENVPKGESLLLFPSKVPVEYYVAMSRLGDDDDESIRLTVDYNSIKSSSVSKLPVSIASYPERLLNFSLQQDSVEFTIMKN